MRRFAICVSLLVASCGGVVVRDDGAGGTTSTARGDGGTTSTASGDDGAKTMRTSAGGATAEGAGGFSPVSVTTYTGGTSTTSGPPYTGGRVGAGGFVGAGGVAIDASVGGGGFKGGASGFGGVAGGDEYVCAARPPSDPVCPPLPLASPPAACTTTAITSDPAGLEGRCIPKCELNDYPLAPLLDAGNPACPSGSSCAPCYDPVDATSTGACTKAFLGGKYDKPTMPAPTPYASCPDGDAGVPPYAGGGVCVPGTMINPLSDPNNPLYDPLIPNLKQDSCAMGEKCMPKAKAADPRHCATPCKTAKPLADIGYPTGACVPTYVVYDTNGVTGVTIFSNTGGAPAQCGKDELCYSCSNPLQPDRPTGACY